MLLNIITVSAALQILYGFVHLLLRGASLIVPAYEVKSKMCKAYDANATENHIRYGHMLIGWGGFRLPCDLL